MQIHFSNHNVEHKQIFFHKNVREKTRILPKASLQQIKHLTNEIGLQEKYLISKPEIKNIKNILVWIEQPSSVWFMMILPHRKV